MAWSFSPHGDEVRELVRDGAPADRKRKQYVLPLVANLVVERTTCLLPRTVRLRVLGYQD